VLIVERIRKCRGKMAARRCLNQLRQRYITNRLNIYTCAIFLISLPLILAIEETTFAGLSAENAARMLAGSPGDVEKSPSHHSEMSLVLPHDTYPGFSIKKFKTHPVKINGSSHAGGAAYHMLDSDYSKYFTVLEDGVVMTTADISPLVNRPVQLVVVEQTPNVTNTHNLQLFVMHRNDMLRFSGSLLDASGEVRENQPAGTRVRGVPLCRPSVAPS